MCTHKANKSFTMPQCNSELSEEASPKSVVHALRFLPTEQRSIEL